MEFELKLKGPFWVEISSNDFEQESNDPLNVDDVHQPVEDYASIPSNEFINMILFCIDNCRWWTLIVLHISTVEHVYGHTV